MKKKVCVFLWNNFINDARVKREVSALTEVGYEVDVICTYDGNENELFEDESYHNSRVIRVMNLKGMKVGALKNNNSPFKLIARVLQKVKIDQVIDVLMVVINMIRFGLKDNYDIFHSNDLKTLPQGYICKLLTKNSKLIYDSHEVETSRAGGKSKIKYIIEKSLIKHTDQVIMTTKTRAEYNAKLYHIEEPAVVHNYPFFIEKDMKRNNLYQEINEDRQIPLLLYQGGFQVGRGIEEILKAVPLFEESSVVFIGDGPLEKKMRDLINDYQISDKVKIIPKVPSEELLYYTQHAYLGFQVLENTCFNHYSALSNKLLEYIMMEVPVIASDLPEMRRVIEVTQAGVLLEDINAQNIAHAVNGLIRDKSLYKAYKKNCADHKARFTWEDEKQVLISIYKKVGERGK